MHTRSLRQWALALTFWLALHASPLKAQTLGPDTESSTTLKFDSTGIFSATGAGTGTFSLSGPGIRMFWYSNKGAFRAGTVDNTQWDDSHIGTSSAAFDYDTTASGNYSFACGLKTNAIGPASSASGYGTNASGPESTAMGLFTSASGYFSTALGVSTQAQAYSSCAVGLYNIGGGTANNPVSGDPLFEIGNGTSTTARSDALIVYKNGIVAVHTELRTAAGGDLSMGSFTAGTAP